MKSEKTRARVGKRADVITLESGAALTYGIYYDRWTIGVLDLLRHTDTLYSVVYKKKWNKIKRAKGSIAKVDLGDEHRII